MRIGMGLLKAETVCCLGESLKRGSLFSYGLARELCEREDWCDAKGKLCVASAAKLRLSLPATRERPGPGCEPLAVPVPDTRCLGPLSRLGKCKIFSWSCA